MKRFYVEPSQSNREWYVCDRKIDSAENLITRTFTRRKAYMIRDALNLYIKPRRL